MEETISLKELFLTLKKRLGLIISITALAVLVSGIISYFFLTPIYQASTQILVNQAKSDQSTYNVGEVQTNLQLINTYNVIIKSPAILDLVNDELKLGMSASELNEKITVQSEQNSQVVNILVQDEDPAQSVLIANKIAAVFQKEIVDIMSVDNVKILAKATVGENPAPIKPQPLLNIAIAMVVGLMVGVGLAFLLEYLDNTIKTEQDIEKQLGLTLLGTILNMDDQVISDRRNNRTSRAGVRVNGLEK
ncbi:YveK family protein [Peribacillus sp. NPDC096379]|uniref:YveK family protein n=1 Tax=Peribacillus sp. NPDC096379 TaxID=3364393 RepID=UPI0037FA6E41